MKTLALLMTLAITAVMNAQKINPAYDSVLARKLNADERGMKSYILVILKSGSYIEKDSVKRAKLFAGHFSNMNKLAGAGKLIVAGPLGVNSNSYRGIFIIDAADAREAAELLKGDPTVTEKIFEPLYFEWYGSAALPEYLPYADKLRKTLPE